MDPIEKKSLDFLVQLTRIIRNMQMYNEKHPTVKTGVQNAHAMLGEILRMQPSLTFGKGENVLLIQNKQMTDKNPAADRFVAMLGERNVSGVIIRRGVPVSETEAFIKLMSTKPEEVVIDGQIKPELLSRFNKISVNEVKYLMVGEEEDLESLTEARKFFNDIFAEEFKNLKGTDALKKLGKVIQKVMPKMQEMDGSKDELWEFFEKTVQSFSGGEDIVHTKQGLITAIRGMDPQVQKSLFGQVVKSGAQVQDIIKKFSNDRKADILASEAINEKKLNEALQNLLKTRGDIVSLSEALVKKFSGEGTDQEKLHNILTLLQQVESGERIVVRKRGKVMIADVEEEYQTTYEDFFKKLNFESELITNGKDLVEKIRNSKPDDRPDLIVMDVKLPERSGIEILSIFDMERIKIPILLCTEMVSIQNSFEVQMYYKLKFMTKPFNYGDFMKAVDELCPRVEEKKDTVVTKAEEKKEELNSELERARDIQRNLMPKQFPKTPGYDLFAFYKSYSEVGGDYYDVIPLGADHFGVLIADVSGHGISGAMVMVMIRSAVRTWVYSTHSPKELLLKVNPMIVRDILPGMFATVYYAIVNMPERKIVCSCAGHNPAVLWKHKQKKTMFTEKGGMPLGILSGTAFEKSIKETEYQLDPGDRLILYTDGMVETMSPEYEEFGEDRFCKVVSKYYTQPSNIFVKQVVAAVTAFQSTAPQHDDLTLVTLRALR